MASSKRDRHLFPDFLQPKLDVKKTESDLSAKKREETPRMPSLSGKKYELFPTAKKEKKDLPLDKKLQEKKKSLNWSTFYV